MTTAESGTGLENTKFQSPSHTYFRASIQSQNESRIQKNVFKSSLVHGICVNEIW